jgi:hypothetical protein
MIGVITIILILVFSILITRIASIALTHTGLSRETSKFQARSAFTGVGFTTSESEKVVNHPLRRRILLILMILGNAGIVTAIASLIIGFAGITDGVQTWLKFTILMGGIGILWLLANSRWIDRQLSIIINRILKKQHHIDVNDYASLLHLSGEYRISEIGIECDHWLCQKKLSDTHLHHEGLNLLAISRKDGTFLGAPARNTTIKEGDSLIIYGRAESLSKLEKRLKGAAGNREHRQMRREQKKVQQHEKEEDQKP